MAKYVNQKGLIEYRLQYKSARCAILDIEEYKPVVDHDHSTGRIRGVISSEGNILIGKLENCFRSRCVSSQLSLPRVLRNIAAYLEAEQGPYHPVGVRQLVRRFSRKTKEEQYDILQAYQYPLQVIEECKNSAERAKLYRQKLVGE